MIKKVLFVILCIVLIGIIVGAAVVYDKLYDDYTGKQSEIQTVDNDDSDKVIDNASEKTEQDEGGEKDNIVPDVEIFHENGSRVMLSEFFEKPVVLNFWATWCGPCKSEMPGFDNLYRKYGDRVNFVMLNVSDTREQVSEFLSENGYSFPVYYDESQAATYTYGASSIPLTFVIDRGGELYGYQIGVLPEDALESAIKTVLGEE